MIVMLSATALWVYLVHQGCSLLFCETWWETFRCQHGTESCGHCLLCLDDWDTLLPSLVLTFPTKSFSKEAQSLISCLNASKHTKVKAIAFYREWPKTNGSTSGSHYLKFAVGSTKVEAKGRVQGLHTRRDDVLRCFLLCSSTPCFIFRYANDQEIVSLQFYYGKKY